MTGTYLDVIDRNVSETGLGVRDKEELFSYVSEKLQKAGILDDAEAFKKDLYYRESLGQTGIGHGVAIPHGKSASVEQTCIVLLKLAEPIAWESADGAPVQVIILFAVSLDDKNDTFLRMMSQVARKLAREEVCEALGKAGSVEEMMEALS